MTTELGNLSSAGSSSLQLSDKSGQVAAQSLSDWGAKEESSDKQDPIIQSQNLQQSQADIEKQVQNLQEFSRSQGWTVNFSVEEELDQVIIKVMDAETKSMIRQIPSEELIAINKRIQALQQGDAGTTPRVGVFINSEI